MPLSTIRFLVLDMVERHGPMHGYEMVRAAARESLALWIDYTAPAMYSATKRLVSEGLLEVIRVERAGRYPPRQIFQITQDGHAALRNLRRDALDDVKAPPSDPFDYALTHLHEHELADLAGVISVSNNASTCGRRREHG
jgi:DNA-binding PadR family transcriptional regulator